MYRIYNKVSMVILEYVAALFGKFHRRCGDKFGFMYAEVHSVVISKIQLFLYHKDSIRKLNLEIGSVGESLEEKFVMKKQEREMDILFYFVSISYWFLTTYGVESARKTITKGKNSLVFRDCNKQSPFTSFSNNTMKILHKISD